MYPVVDVISFVIVAKFESWNHDLFVPGNGYIEGTELDGFLREFVSSANVTDISPEVSVVLVCKNSTIEETEHVKIETKLLGRKRNEYCFRTFNFETIFLFNKYVIE